MPRAIRHGSNQKKIRSKDRETERGEVADEDQDSEPRNGEEESVKVTKSRQN